MNDTKQLNYNFWQQFISESIKRTDLLKNRKPIHSEYISINAGMKRVSLLCGIKQESGDVSIYIDYDLTTGEKNKYIFDKLSSNKAQIEAELGFPLNWHRLNKARASWISFNIKKGGLKHQDDWDILQDEMIDALIKVDKAFRPRLKKIEESMKK